MGKPSGIDRQVPPAHGLLLEKTILYPVILGHLGGCQPEVSKSFVSLPLWNMEFSLVSLSTIKSQNPIYLVKGRVACLFGGNTQDDSILTLTLQSSVSKT